MSRSRSHLRHVAAFVALVTALVLVPSSAPPAQADVVDDWALVSPPDIWGTPRVGESLGANQGEWSPGPYAARFTWLRDGTEVLKSTSYSSYVVQPEDEGHMISARITVTRPDLGERTATTVQVGPINADRPLYAPYSPLLGLPHPGQTLDVNPAPWVTDNSVVVPDVAVAYQWIRSIPNQDSTDEVIAGATARTYIPTTDDLGWSIRVEYLGSKSGYYSYPETKYAGVIVRKVENLTVPTVEGDAVVGGVLTGRPGTWVPEQESEYFRLSFQWLRDGATIPGATTLSYPLGAADSGRQISLRVTGDGYGYFRQTLVSTSTPSTVRPRPIVQPPAPAPAPVASVIRARGKSGGKGTASLTIRVTPARAATVTILDGRKVLKRGLRLKNGAVVVKLKKLKKGRHTFTIRCPARSDAAAATARVTLRVR